MVRFGRWMAEHPQQTGLMVAVLCGMAGYQAWKIGRTGALIEMLSGGDAARAASEALGG